MADISGEMVSTRCAICVTDAHDKELYPANFKPEDFSPEIFSARRLPDKIHYRIVTCQHCGLIRSNPVLNPQSLARLYELSHFTYPQESIWAAQTYAHYFTAHLGDLPKDIHVLEVGCGNGTFLNELYQQGYTNIFGIEPSRQAVEQAGPMSGFIHQGVLTEGIYPPGHFDVIAVFQVFDHISRPDEFLRDCFTYLKPGGRLLMVMHDIHALTARILGRRCPMVDIEHPFLYNRSTLEAVLTKHGFSAPKTFEVHNRYPLKYWGKLLPLPLELKQNFVTFLDRHSVGNIPLTLGAGNMGVVAVKGN